ncbi:hypothetical protein [Neobacillus sp. 19]|uniref:hypothetical protein n=1 Tax=Neobacillus sp. 19 TaxID=3394458 RepID=UPI003BF67F74
MFWLWLTLSILLVLFIIIILTKLTIIVNYYHHNDNDDLMIEFRVWFVIKYKINVPLIKIDDDSPSVVVKSHSHMGDSDPENPEHKVNQITNKDVTASLKKTKEILEKVFNLHVIVRKFFRKVTVKKLEWDSLVGLGDAADGSSGARKTRKRFTINAKTPI